MVNFEDWSPTPDSGLYSFSVFYIDRYEKEHYHCQPVDNVIIRDTFRIPKDAISIAIEVFVPFTSDDGIVKMPVDIGVIGNSN